MYIIHIYRKAYTSVRGYKDRRIGKTKTSISPSNLSPMVYVDIYLKVLLISVCLEK